MYSIDKDSLVEICVKLETAADALLKAATRTASLTTPTAAENLRDVTQAVVNQLWVVHSAVSALAQLMRSVLKANG